jgi:hypothetical protein
MSYYTDFRFRFYHNLAIEPPDEYFVELVWQLIERELSYQDGLFYVNEVGRMGRDSLDCARFTKNYPDLTLRVDYRGEEFEDVGTQWWQAGELLAESRWPMDQREEG